jgi:hypothetical protein
MRADLAAAVAAVPGMGGVRWTGRHTHTEAPAAGGDCAVDVAAI